MRRPRKSRQPQAAPPPHTPDAQAGPLGSWAYAEMLAMPRFPDRDSFPAARGLVDRFLSQDGITYRDLRIALFWLGFGLLEKPTPERPTMSLVPLCKDLDLYEDTAAELGYDPMVSVHGRPTFPQVDSANLEVGLAVNPDGTGPSSSSSSGSHSSSSSSGPQATAASSAGRPPQAGRDQVSVYVVDENDEDDPWDENRDSPDCCGSRRPLQGGGASSSAWAVQELDGEGRGENSRLLEYKVKLLHAGGWSSSSESEGNRTPPTPPPASSSAAAAAGGEAQAGGLDYDHVEQFTVSFVSDHELHEEIRGTSCLCTFCLDDMEVGEELCRLPCMHTFHRRCVYAWLQRDRRCMLCRLDVTRPCG